jgi:N-acetylglutamate synthase-like GNAT family acetyltransferase/DNA-binding MarR family transcriptional regulator
MDIISELGEMAFATRLKRLGERLGRDVSLLYRKLNIDFDARWFAIFYSLKKHSPMTVTGLAGSLGISHTAVRQLLNVMSKKELVTWSEGKVDRRFQLVYLTVKGRKIARRLSPVWKEIRGATRELIGSSGCDVISGLGMIERELEDLNMYERVWLRLNGRLPGDVTIREYSPAMKKYFRSLNYEWLEGYFSVEKTDERMLSDPKGRIVKNGGAVLFACLDGEVVGTCALIKHRGDVYELAKMAVTKKYQGRGIGKKLLLAVMEKAKSKGAKDLYLRTNPKLEAANHLYLSSGFSRCEGGIFSKNKYKRSTIVMKMDLNLHDQ